MLRQRVLTALVLLAVLLGAVLLPRPEPFVLILLLMASCALWEWLRLIHPGAGKRALTGAIILGVVLVWLKLQWFAGWPDFGAQTISRILTQGLIPLAVLCWSMGASIAVARGQLRTGVHVGQGLFAAGAVLAAWAALVWLYQAHGGWALLSLMALVWCADVAAYFAGRSWGRHKLAPRVSPGKTWEGAVAGILAAMAWALFSMQWEGSFFALLAQRHAVWLTCILAGLMAALSVVGDLYESLLKRRAGMKDSSALLPGHGGVLDRIDALLPVAPAAWLVLQPPWL